MTVHIFLIIIYYIIIICKLIYFDKNLRNIIKLYYFCKFLVLYILSEYEGIYSLGIEYSYYTNIGTVYYLYYHYDVEPYINIPFS